jgi:hypothetical protein
MATLQFQKTCRRSMHGTKEPDVTHKNTYQLRKRLNGHRSDEYCKSDLPLSRHLRSTGHHDSFGKLKVTIIDHNPKWDDKSIQER